MNFDYRINSSNNGVILIGIKDVCPKELHIPSILEIDNQELKVTGIRFISRASKDSNGITCDVLFIPETVVDIRIANNKYIQEVFLPSSITKLTAYSFLNCVNLKTIHLPSKLEKIGPFAFRGCKNLDKIVIPSSVMQIEYRCFSGCSSLTSIIIPEGVTEIESNTFEGCTSLSEVIIKNESAFFRPTTFTGCKSLRKLDGHLIEDGLLFNSEKTELYTYLGDNNSNGMVVVPESVRELGDGFSSEELVSIDLSKAQISTIRNDTFENCINLEKVILPPTIHSIGERAFKDCKKLSQIVLPNSIEEIGVACFWGCCSLKEIYLPESLTIIPNFAFKDCTNLSKVSIPLSVKTIYNSAFENCTKIKHVTIDEGFRDKASKFFSNHDTIEFVFVARYSSTPSFRRTGAYTHGRLRPCPYCGSNDVRLFCDGTAECNECGGEYTYQY